MATTTIPVTTAFEPRIVAFFCNWCTYTASDLAGTARLSYEPNAPGCHPGDCHYQEGNYKALRRFRLLKRVLTQFGVDDARVRLEWISASEGDRVQHVINEMTDQLRTLGPWHARS
jgi:F420-non-reducing hydrogenase iron-sulfur subunit